MKQHTTDLIALLFGLAFTITGGLVLVTQVTDIEVNPHWGAAVSLIVLGVVALGATFARTRRDPSGAPVAEPLVWPVTPEETIG